MPRIARFVSTNPQAYVYLWESINAWHQALSNDVGPHARGPRP